MILTIYKLLNDGVYMSIKCQMFRDYTTFMIFTSSQISQTLPSLPCKSGTNQTFPLARTGIQILPFKVFIRGNVNVRF